MCRLKTCQRDVKVLMLTENTFVFNKANANILYWH